MNDNLVPATGGTLTGDLTISKASAVMRVAATSGAPSLNIDTPAAAYDAYLNFRTGTSPRWSWSKSSTEAGANSGSNLNLHAYNDAGSLLSTPLSIVRSTGAATFTGDVTVSKATPTLELTGSGAGFLRVNSTDNHASLLIDSAAGLGNARIRFRTGADNRWELRKNFTAESGSNAGSNFELVAYADDGSTVLSTPVTIARSTGKITAGSVGATAGIEYGASGPRDMAGTGSPEGVVTAPVGSTWRDTNATTGAIKWIKATGTGNTGWAVEYGDTGWRNITVSHAPNANGWAASLQRIRRVGATVQYVAAFENTSGTTATGAVTGVILPTGMRTSLSQQFYVATNSSSVGRLAVVESTGDVNLWGYDTVASFQLSLSWATADAWPTSLPGIPA